MIKLHFFLLIAAMALIPLWSNCAVEQPINGDERFTIHKVSFNSSDIWRKKFFFLDTAYRSSYIYRHARPDLPLRLPPAVTELSVWRSYTYLPPQKVVKKVTVDSSDELRIFECLKPFTHYVLDEREGYIRFHDSVYIQPDQTIAIFMRTEDADFNHAMQKGVVSTGSADTLWNLWTLWSQELSDEDPARASLPWRHAYILLAPVNQILLNITVYRIGKDDNGYFKKARNDEGTCYSDLLGITEDGDYRPKYFVRPEEKVYYFNFSSLVFPPYDTTAAGLDIFNNPLLGDYRDSLLYTGSASEVESLIRDTAYRPLYEIEYEYATPKVEK